MVGFDVGQDGIELGQIMECRSNNRDNPQEK